MPRLASTDTGFVGGRAGVGGTGFGVSTSVPRFLGSSSALSAGAEEDEVEPVDDRAAPRAADDPPEPPPQALSVVAAMKRTARARVTSDGGRRMASLFLFTIRFPCISCGGDVDKLQGSS